MDFPFPEACNRGENISLSSDQDSTYFLTGTMDDTKFLVDSVVTPHSYFEFTTIISRTYSNNGSRFLLFFRNAMGRPKSKYGLQFSKLALERLANVNFCSIINSAGVKLYLSYIYIGREVIDTNYLTKMELAVLVSAMNYAKMYYFHPGLTAPRTFLQANDLLDYGTFLQSKHSFEGKVSDSDQKKYKKKRTQVTFPSHYGRIYFKSIFECLKMFGEDIDSIKNVGGTVPPNNPLIKPWDVCYHGVESVVFDEETFSTLAWKMYTKGAITAQDPGTKDHFAYSPIERKHLLAVNSVDSQKEWGDHLTAMLRLQKSRFAGMFDPMVFLPIRADTVLLEEGRVQHFDDRFVDRELRTGGLLKFYDAGFMLDPENHLDRKCFLPNGPKCGWWLNLLMSGVRFNDVVETPNETAANIVQMAGQENDVTLLQGIVDLLHIPQTDPDVYIDYQNLRHILDNYLADPPPPEAGSFDLILLDMLQDFHPDDLGTGNGLTVDTILGMMRHTGQRAYNVFGTNGKVANIHTGKIELLVEIMDNVQEEYPAGTMKLSIPPSNPYQGLIHGGQIYNPAQRTMVMVQVRTDMTELLNIPHLLLEVLRPDQVGPRIVEYSETRIQLHCLMERMKDIVDKISSKIKMMSSFGLRIELFMKYEREENIQFENLEFQPCPATIFDAYPVNDLKNFMYHGIVHKFNAIEKVVQYDAINQSEFQRSDFARSLHPDQITTLVMFSEQMLINLGISHYQGRFVNQMQKKKLGLKERLGAYCIPELACTESGQDALDRYSLPFSVSCQEYLALPMNTTVHDATFILRGRRIPPHLAAESNSLRKNVSHPLLYVQAMEKIRCMLLQAVNEQRQTYTPLDSIDQEYLACELPADNRCDLGKHLMQELCSVYDFCWYTLINGKHRDLRTQDLSRTEFPRTLRELNSMLDHHGDTYPHLIPLGQSNMSYRIKTDGKNHFVVCFRIFNFCASCAIFWIPIELFHCRF